MEWGTILILGILVLFATCYLWAGLMSGDFSLILTLVGLVLSAGVIYCLVGLFKVSLGNGFVGLGIGIVVALLSAVGAEQLNNESISDWFDWMD